jgi:hypothetical protein
LLAFISLWITLSRESWWRYNNPLAIPLIILSRNVQSSCLLFSSSAIWKWTLYSCYWTLCDTSIYLPICKMRPFKIIPDNLIIFMFNILKRWKSRLEFGMYSYTSIFSSSSMQQPNSFTRFLCCSLAMKITSFLNSSEPWSDVCESLLTAISVPSGKVP